ncbi:MAG TPA: hypothetical protein VFN71_03740 [Methylomirabilota bacterium]|nr:hypothetical protein [Methylomirabilota bacterium]
MSQPMRPSARPWSRSAVLPCLLGVVLALGAFQASQLLHLHEAASPGLYNESHVLASLESVSGDAPLPQAAAAPGPELLPGAQGTAPGPQLSNDPLRTSDPRAPPLA